MQTFKETLMTITLWLRHVTELGFALILTLVVVDILFPGSTGVVNNIGVIVGQFSKEGLAGLIALLLFLLLFKHKTQE